MNETWKDITGFEGKYQISSFGRVKSLSRKCGTVIRKDKIINPREHTSGYQIVSLGSDYKYKNYYIHILVAKHFIDNPMSKPQVNHIDEDKKNNNMDNLEWVTRSENMTHNKLHIRKWNTRGRNKYIVYNTNDKQYLYFENYQSYSDMDRLGITPTDRSKANKSSHKTKGLIITNLKLI